MKMLPGMSSQNIPDDMLNSAEGRLDKWQRNHPIHDP